MEVTELTAETFWKGETEIRGTVMDGEDEYRVRILRKGSQNFDYSCNRKKSWILRSLLHTGTGRDPDVPACPCPARGVDPQGEQRVKTSGLHFTEGPLYGPGIHKP